MLMEATFFAKNDSLNDVDTLLSMHGIYKSFGATKALENVSINFSRGEIHCLLGENGAGKSTIGKIIGGLYRPQQGQMFWRDEPVSFKSINDSRDCGIGLVYQELSLAPHLSIRANLRLGVDQSQGVFSLLKHQEEVRDAEEVLGRLGLDLDVERPVNELPTATQQMVEIAKALMLSPELIVFDEPTSTLGAVEKRKLFDVLRQQRDQGKAIVMITHHIDDVMEVADRISIMRNGRLVDSFVMAPEITADCVLERLAGRRIEVVNESRDVPEQRAQLLVLENVPHRNNASRALTVRCGEIVGFYGVVGSGAEDLTRALVGLGGMRQLHCLLNGKAYRPHNPAHAVSLGVSYLPSGRASNGVFPTLSIRENLSLALLSLIGRYGVVLQKAEQAQIDTLLEKFHVKYASADDLITSLSGGNQQKVLLARAMARAKQLLILEEPTAGVDIDSKMSIHEKIRGLADAGTSVILLSSDLLETLSLCDTVYTMYEGEIVNTYTNPTLDEQPAIICDVLGQRSPQA